ncbi:Imm10 family immunity protein [Streptosporangium sp. OZ121]|uniref:Imm10 family immunity protein n=1 Tax=Streptosporangium sp. OZ121 TaxID=3444183 RepID=UPI003F79937F
MRFAADKVNLDEDWDDEVLEVVVVGSEGALTRSLSFQRSLHDPDEQEIQLGWDTYSVSMEDGKTDYGCLSEVQLSGGRLTLNFLPDVAESLGWPEVVEVDLRVSEEEIAEMATVLRSILEWGRRDSVPRISGI